MKKRKVDNGMVSRIKDRVTRSGRGIGAFLFIPADKKVKVRFISDLDQAVPIIEHDKWPDVLPTPCLKHHFKKECIHCEDETVRKREVYCWTAWDYGSKEKKVVKFAANQFTPTPQLISAFETYGTLLDRDYVISKTGQGTNITYGVMPLDKVKFSRKLRPFSDDEILEKCIEASDEVDMDDIDELDDTEDALEDEIEDEEDDEEEVEEDDEEEEEEDDEEDEEEEEEEDDDFDFEDDEPFDDEEEEEKEKPKSKKKR